MDERVRNYWTRRAHDFGLVRRNELGNDMSVRWLRELEARLPKSKSLRILDVGTGAGFFPILLARGGLEACGIDNNAAMLDEARKLASEKGCRAEFIRMDAQELDFPDESFDAVISRNLTWTLPEPRRAYSEWLRVLKSGGLLLNYDADYGAQERSRNMQNVFAAPDSPYGHVGMTDELELENADITLSMSISRVSRPEWDADVLRSFGCGSVSCDAGAGARLLGSLDLVAAPMFLIKAIK